MILPFTNAYDHFRPKYFISMLYTIQTLYNVGVVKLWLLFSITGNMWHLDIFHILILNPHYQIFEYTKTIIFVNILSLRVVGNAVLYEVTCKAWINERQSTLLIQKYPCTIWSLYNITSIYNWSKKNISKTVNSEVSEYFQMIKKSIASMSSAGTQLTTYSSFFSLLCRKLCTFIQP